MYEYRDDEEMPDVIGGQRVVGEWSDGTWRYPIFSDALVVGESHCWDEGCPGTGVAVMAQDMGPARGGVAYFRFCPTCESEQTMGAPDPSWSCPHCGVNRGPHAVGCGPLNWPTWGPAALARAEGR